MSDWEPAAPRLPGAPSPAARCAATIKGYRSCLASDLSRTGMVAAVQAKTISDMIMSMELQQRPRLTPVLPQWDLGIAEMPNLTMHSLR